MNRVRIIVIFVLQDQQLDWSSTGTGTVLVIYEDEKTRLVDKDVPEFSIYCRLSIQMNSSTLSDYCP